MTRRIVVQTLNGEQTIEGMTVGALKDAIRNQADDAVVAFMFEMTPTIRSEMEKADVMLMPAHAAFGSSGLLCFVGPEIQNAPFEAKEQWRKEYEATPPPVDLTQETTTDGRPLDQRPETDDPKGQHSNYLILNDAERAKGFVRPYRDAYRHLECGSITTMGRSIAETYARCPHYYSSTYCAKCQGHFRVGESGEFTWVEMDGSEGPKVGT